MKMKKLLALALAMSMTFGLAACGKKDDEQGSASASKPEASQSGEMDDVSKDPKVKLVYAEVNPLDSIVGQTATAFKEKVEELSGGSKPILSFIWRPSCLP